MADLDSFESERRSLSDTVTSLYRGIYYTNGGYPMDKPRRVINFGAGPTKLPEPVMLKAQEELLNYNNLGIGVLEMSHRGPEFAKILNDTIASFKELFNVPDNYRVLLMHGGANGQFSAVPLNLMGLKAGRTADYIVTGYWSQRAAKEAEKYGKINRVLPEREQYNDIPDVSKWKLDPNASYVYYCANETINGVEFQNIPETNGVPLVADMSSNIFSRVIDVSKFGIIIAGAHKNMGPSGVTVVIIREDLIGHAEKYCPGILDYKAIADTNCLYNTPATFTIYVMGLVFDWVRELGGLPEIERRNIKKAKMIYDVVNSSGGFYSVPVLPHCRSRMNIPMWIYTNGTPNKTLEKTFVTEAKAAGLIELEGHRVVGGLRVTLYNPVTLEETQILAEFMKNFQNKYQK